MVKDRKTEKMGFGLGIETSSSRKNKTKKGSVNQMYYGLGRRILVDLI